MQRLAQRRLAGSCCLGEGVRTFFGLIGGNLVEGDESTGVAIGGEVFGEEYFDEFGDGAIEDGLVDLGKGGVLLQWGRIWL